MISAVAGLTICTSLSISSVGWSGEVLTESSTDVSPCTKYIVYWSRERSHMPGALKVLPAVAVEYD